MLSKLFNRVGNFGFLPNSSCTKEKVWSDSQLTNCRHLWVCTGWLNNQNRMDDGANHCVLWWNLDEEWQIWIESMSTWVDWVQVYWFIWSTLDKLHRTCANCKWSYTTTRWSVMSTCRLPLRLSTHRDWRFSFEPRITLLFMAFAGNYSYNVDSISVMSKSLVRFPSMQTTSPGFVWLTCGPTKWPF